MATLTIRNLPDEVRDRLRIRAALNRRSMEAEVRTILQDVSISGSPDVGAASGLDDLSTLVDKLYGDSKPTGVVDELIAERRREAEREEEESR